jgi:hypothetical protein
MKKTCIIFFVIFIFSFSGYKDNLEYIIIIKNDTEQDITLLSFSKPFKNEVPIVIKPYAQKELFTDMILTGIDIGFSYDEKKLGINTGYADDFLGFTLRFSGSETSPYGIDCFFAAKSKFNSGLTGPREIKEIE